MTKPTLTKAQQAAADNIAKAKQITRDAQKALNSLLESCKHIFYDNSDSATCAICKADGGWFCPDNPVGVCEYDPADYCKDECIHCGSPEERK